MAPRTTPGLGSPQGTHSPSEGITTFIATTRGGVDSRPDQNPEPRAWNPYVPQGLIEGLRPAARGEFVERLCAAVTSTLVLEFLGVSTIRVSFSGRHVGFQIVRWMASAGGVQF